MKKESIPQEGIIILNVYMPDNRAPTYLKQKLQEERDESATIVGDFRPF